ncbi:lysophospholipid acyltransferase family protein [Ancrocorticia populi]|uniref:1-acyl-sn-glycerol-3-phosphate acyltransferase n=3 Tax=Ancrocorticia populi TaxID=2175228 RepID=A0A2V1KA45_9ACTO|nr:lysophospholipid acyltransferase family protein [Ancrocorticia populi]MDN6487283.1 1-acyl-sn-glycerol-3-phosphate acyltransferase [Ancrocorticia sp.]PWF27180.1 1-acyl-sn-glycerol-3-phosphate acyltransferase [Ancrocorticia populi]
MPENLEPLEPYLNGGRQRRRHWVRHLVTRPVISTVVRPTVLGEENVRDLEGAFIITPNHSSHLDAPMVFSLLPETLTERLATGAAADYFYRRRFISGLTSLFFNSYPIERKGKNTQGGRAAGMTGRLLRAGVPILVFPEGTRSRDGQMGTPKAGAAALAIQNSIPLVPVAMAGGHEAMPVGAPFPKVGNEVFLFIGKPMYGMPDETPDELMARTFVAIQAMLDQGTPHPEIDGRSPFDPPSDCGDTAA